VNREDREAGIAVRCCSVEPTMGSREIKPVKGEPSRKTVQARQGSRPSISRKGCDCLGCKACLLRGVTRSRTAFTCISGWVLAVDFRAMSAV